MTAYDYIKLKKPPKFREIPGLTPKSNYSIDVGWRQINNWVDDQKKSNDADFDPDFQRDHVWDTEKQIAFVEFSLRGGTNASHIYFNCHNYQEPTRGQGTFTLVDGKQRLTAAQKFIE